MKASRLSVDRFGKRTAKSYNGNYLTASLNYDTTLYSYLCMGAFWVTVSVSVSLLNQMNAEYLTPALG